MYIPGAGVKKYTYSVSTIYLHQQIRVISHCCHQCFISTLQVSLHARVFLCAFHHVLCPLCARASLYMGVHAPEHCYGNSPSNLQQVTH